jgi:hypothetical protein
VLADSRLSQSQQQQVAVYKQMQGASKTSCEQPKQAMQQNQPQLSPGTRVEVDLSLSFEDAKMGMSCFDGVVKRQHAKGTVIHFDDGDVMDLDLNVVPFTVLKLPPLTTLIAHQKRTCTSDDINQLSKHRVFPPATAPSLFEGGELFGSIWKKAELSFLQQQGGEIRSGAEAAVGADKCHWQL